MVCVCVRSIKSTMASYHILCFLICAALVGVIRANEIYNDCEKPPEVIHGSFEIEDLENSIKAIYRCQTGYLLKGPTDLVCDLDSDQWNGQPPTCVPEEAHSERKKKLLAIPEEPNVSEEMAAILDMSCIQAKVQAPEIRHGVVSKYERRRQGEKVFLVAYYGCNDNYDFEDAQVNAMYCRSKQWVGEIPTCIPQGEYTEDDEGDEEEEGGEETDDVEYDEYETVAGNESEAEGEQETDDAVVEAQPVAPPPPPPVVEQEQQPQPSEPELIPEQAPEPQPKEEEEEEPEIVVRVVEEETTVAPAIPEVEVSPVAPVTDINIVVEPTQDPYTPRILDDQCGEDRGGCAHKCERLLFPGENEPRLKCSCFDGFTLDPNDYATCHDIDECQESNGGCSQICNNLPGSYECGCEKGYKIDSLTGNTCLDINECRLRNGHGPCQDTCHNLTPGYRCSCAGLPGTQLASDGHACVDAGECANNNGGCSHGCVSTMGRVFCLCPEGFTMSADGKTCTDIDECTDAEILAQCVHGCENLPGSYRCVELPTAVVDAVEDKPIEVEEEEEEEANEIEEEPAVIVPPTKILVCEAGFSASPDGSECLDINECEIIVDDEGNDEHVPHRICQQQCENFVGSYACSCDVGYHLLEDRHRCAPDTCEDLDNPQLNRTRCAHLCANRPDGSYECICPKGYKLDEDRHSCVVAESACQRDKGHESCRPGSCQDNEDNTSFSCVCPPGYLDEVYRCQDIDECAANTHECSHTCYNTEGGYQCVCPVGMLLADNEHDCVTQDPCAVNKNGCEQLCLTDPAGHCACHVGYTLSNDTKSCIDIDECHVNNGDCQQLCRNIPGAYECECASGFEFLDGALSGYCFDIDECARGIHECGQTMRCENLNGSYTCICEPGYALGFDPSSSSSSTSQLSSISSHACLDIDECSLDNGNCSHFCLNYPGSFQCACQPGFTLDATDNSSCLPDNPCFLHNGGCSHTCNVATLGGVAFCSCPLGYTLAPDMRSCLDNDECQHENGHCAQLCFNTDGGFACACSAGYVLSPDGFGCLDIDECSIGFGNCSTICINLLGSHACACDPGYELAEDGRTCVDVDECAATDASITGCSHQCVNTPGGYECRCPPGLSLIDSKQCQVICGPGYGRSSLDASRCEDVNECLEADICQHQCENLPGSYKCLCPVGHTLASNQRDCVDVDECAVGNGGCIGGTCVNQPGSYKCQCNDDQTLSADGRSCVAVRKVVERPLQPVLPNLVPPTVAVPPVLSKHPIRDLCMPFQAPPNGKARCHKYRNKRKQFYNSRCRVWCNPGYQLQGSAQRNCGASGIWEGPPNSCIPIGSLLPTVGRATCPPLKPPRNGVIFPPACTQRSSSFGGACHLQCHLGYSPATTIMTTCMNNGWSFGAVLECRPFGQPMFRNPLPIHTSRTSAVPLAAPITPPVYIKCPQSTVIVLNRGESKAHVKLQKPLTNVDYRLVQANPLWASQLEAHLQPGVHEVTYQVRDPATGKTVSCKTIITIQHSTAAPQANDRLVQERTSVATGGSFCTPSFVVHLKENQNLRSITWEEPRFEGHLVNVFKSHFPGALFQLGDHTIRYEATTSNGLKEQCVFTIHVKAPVPTPAPIHHAPISYPKLSAPLLPPNPARSAELRQDTGHSLFPSHESYVVCPDAEPVKVTASQSVNLPVGCTLKNVRRHPHHQGYPKRVLLRSLWHPRANF